ncbi:MAG: zf-HC2 domain-containing protein [Acidimicrobiia bacterium]
MTWHIDANLIDGYRIGAFNRSAAASIEAHVSGCEECRRLVMPDVSWLDEGWVAVADRVEAPQPNAVERVLVFMGVSSHLARLVAVTPGLRPSWLGATTFVLLFAAFAAQVAVGRSGMDLFLAVAPLIPVAGVAFAYGQMVDPAHEITIAAPLDGFRLLLIRSAAVTAASTVISLGVDVLVPSPGITAVWLLPALALTLSSLAVGTRLPMWMAASGVAGGWVLLLIITGARSMPTAAFQPAARVYFVAVMAVAGIVLARRHDLYRRGETR